MLQSLYANKKRTSLRKWEPTTNSWCKFQRTLIKLNLMSKDSRPATNKGRSVVTSSAALVAVAFLSAGCDPIINFYGSFFPAWVICLALGIFLTALLRWLFAITRIERHLGPLALIYPALAFLLSAGIWLTCFGP
jgi:hypothetical protein